MLIELIELQMSQKATTTVSVSKETKLRLEKMKKSISKRMGRSVSYDEAIRTLLGRS